MNQDLKIKIHLQNYRIAFDAMRAYHVSEIEHKKDMISILNSILLTIVTVYGGIFIYLFSENYNLIIAAFGIGIISLIYIILIIHLKKESIIKIGGDNDRYEKFREECRLSRDYLTLTRYFDLIALEKEPVQPETNMFHRKAIYWDRAVVSSGQNREGTGYLKTIKIINIYSNLLILIVISLLLVLILILFDKETQQTSIIVAEVLTNLR